MNYSEYNKFAETYYQNMRFHYILLGENYPSKFAIVGKNCSGLSWKDVLYILHEADNIFLKCEVSFFAFRKIKLLDYV